MDTRGGHELGTQPMATKEAVGEHATIVEMADRVGLRDLDEQREAWVAELGG